MCRSFQFRTIALGNQLFANQTCGGNREGDICCRSFVSLTNDAGCKSEILVLARLSPEQRRGPMPLPGRHVEDVVPDSSRRLGSFLLFCACMPRVVVILHGRRSLRFTSTDGRLQTQRGRLDTGGLPLSHQGQRVFRDHPSCS